MVELLRGLRRRSPVPMRVVWDRGHVHDKSKAVRASLAGHPSISTEEFPSPTPEANPDAGAWQHTEHGRPANFTPEDTEGLRTAVPRELTRLHRSPTLLASFIRHKIPIRLPRSFR
jgi:hypothetical protein